MNAQGTYASRDTEDVERFCNHVASLVLLDEELFLKQWQIIESSLSLEDKIARLSYIFKVSEEVIARRLLQESIISQQKYTELRSFYQERLLELKKMERQKLKDKASAPSYYTTMLMNNGYAFTHTVLSAYGGGSIAGRDASSLLNVKVNNFGELAIKAGVRLPLSLSKE